MRDEKEVRADQQRLLGLMRTVLENLSDQTEPDQARVTMLAAAAVVLQNRIPREKAHQLFDMTIDLLEKARELPEEGGVH